MNPIFRIYYSRCRNNIHAGVIALALAFCHLVIILAPAKAADTDCKVLSVEIELPRDPGVLPDGDQRPACATFDFQELLRRSGMDGELDLGTLRIERLDKAGGRPVSGAKFAYAETPFDLPMRWDDEKLYAGFPTVHYVNAKTGKLDKKPTANAGLYYNVTPTKAARGRLVWTHTKSGGEPSYYRMEIAVRPKGSKTGVAARGWIGDGAPRFTTNPPGTTATSHTRVDVGDINGDGLLDIIYGEYYGVVLVMLNQGTPSEPRFGPVEFLLDEEGDPIDAGVTAAPHLIDWDGDGKLDLLVGVHWNRLLFFKNMGGSPLPRFSYRGPVTLDGKPLELPFTPVVGRPEGAFQRDYYPVPGSIDWNGDGTLDLLLGGYTTGRIFLFETTGRAKDGTPILKARGPIMADGKIINVGDWSAAPSSADINGDGLPDLVSGNMPMTPESWAKEMPLRYYVNVGSKGNPVFREEPFPAKGNLPKRTALLTPRFADMNGDGVLDMVVSTSTEISIYINDGTRTAPSFVVTKKFIRPANGNTPVPVTQWVDWNKDGLVDALSDYTIRQNKGAGDPFIYADARNAIDGQKLPPHKSGGGDGWFFTYLYDFDGDGVREVLCGDWYGQIWLHRRSADGIYDPEGALLRLENGEPIKVGPKEGDVKKSFLAMQGARTVFVPGDFRKCGKTDLIVSDTYGIVRYFKNVGTNQQPVYQEAPEVGNLKQRLSVDTIDWNNDGWLDIIAGSANGRVEVFINKGASANAGGDQFEKGFAPRLPPIVQPRIITGDINGDGDVDLFFPSTQGSVWIERSFLDHGYAEGKIMSVSIGEK